jgi:glycine cleavage system H protein
MTVSSECVNVPEDLRYSSDHEWARLEGDQVRIGITDYAQDALGDIVYVQLPEPGSATTAGQPLCELESTKSVSDVYAPVDGTVVEVNTELVDAPQRVNEDPYGEGWICVIKLASPDAPAALMGAEEYRKLIEA